HYDTSRCVNVYYQLTMTDIRALINTVQENGTSHVVFFHVIIKRCRNVLVCRSKIGFSLLVGKLIGVQTCLAVVRREETTVFVINAFFHICGAQETLAAVLIIHCHVVTVLCAAVNSRADKEYVRFLFGIPGFAVSPVFLKAVIRKGGVVRSRFCLFSFFCFLSLNRNA